MQYAPLHDKFQFNEVFIVGNGLCAVPENVRQMARNDTQVVPYKVFAFYANTSINRNLKSQLRIKWLRSGFRTPSFCSLLSSADMALRSTPR